MKRPFKSLLDLFPELRYRRQPEFRTLVDAIEIECFAAGLTLSDAHAAATLASIHHARRHKRRQRHLGEEKTK